MVSSFEDTISLESRRYIGSKTKLADWIFSVIDEQTKDVQSFCDIFAGTGTIAKRALNRFSSVIINDFLFSNTIIYNGFFAPGEWDKSKLQAIVDSYNKLNPSKIADNYFSINYGGKYFEHGVSKLIGYIRQNIEDIKTDLTPKEYAILLSSLIYSMDRIANTIGHYEAYIRKPIALRPLNMRLIDAKAYDTVQIYREDSNDLVRRIKADIFYVDPPYNSRQYSRFYHLYETLVHWDNRELSGVAMKPKCENMSEYCSSKAVLAFEDLVQHINAKYIVVSYNNTYQSKSSSSMNKISLDELLSVLNKKGTTQVFEQAYRFFNAGKTDFSDHKELLFITNVYE